MKNIKKTASLFLAYLFVLSILPLGILTKTASAEGLPEYLKYSENYITTKLQYKDVSLVSYYDKSVKEGYPGEILERTKKGEVTSFKAYSPMVSGKRFIASDEGVYDIYEGKYIKTKKEVDEYVNNVISKEYGKNSKLYYYTVLYVEDNGDMWISFSGTTKEVNGNYFYGLMTPTSKIIEGYVNQVNDKGVWSYETIYNGEEITGLSIINYDKNGNKKEIKVDKGDVDWYSSSKNIGDYVYVSTYKNDVRTILKYDINKEQQIGIKVNIDSLDNISIDKDNNLWRAKEGYAQKFDGNNWINIYKVDQRMNDIEVYDKDHMIVTGWWAEKETYKIKGIYTIIDNGDVIEPGNGQGGETPQNPTQGNNGGGSDSETDNGEDNKTPVVVDKGTDDTGNKFVEVSKLPNKDSVNSIEIDTKDSKAFTAEITDINTVREGKGSFNIKGGNTIINLPFSTIDKELLKDGSKVVLTSKVEDNSDITKNIKGLKKVFNFELSVVDKDNNVTAIHQFSDGQAEITITLSDEDLKGLDKAKLAVFYYNEETKQFEMMDTKVDGNNLIFKTSHFSKYIIAEKSANGGSQLPQTGSLATQNQVLAIGMLILIAGTAILYSKRKRA